jgi:hypothetical protein
MVSSRPRLGRPACFDQVKGFFQGLIEAIVTHLPFPFSAIVSGRRIASGRPGSVPELRRFGWLKGAKRAVNKFHGFSTGLNRAFA